MTDMRAIALLLDALRTELRAAALQVTASNGRLQKLLSETEWEEARLAIRELKEQADNIAREVWKH